MPPFTKSKSLIDIQVTPMATRGSTSEEGRWGVLPVFGVFL
jgi:hypothetical protein